MIFFYLCRITENLGLISVALSGPVFLPNAIPDMKFVNNNMATNTS